MLLMLLLARLARLELVRLVSRLFQLARENSGEEVRGLLGSGTTMMCGHQGKERALIFGLRARIHFLPKFGEHWAFTDIPAKYIGSW